MHLILILIVCLSLFTDDSPAFDRRVAHPAWAVTATWLGVALVAGLGELLSRFFVRRIRAATVLPDRIIRRYNQCRIVHLVLMLAVYLLTLFRIESLGLGWSGVVRGNLGLHDAVLLDELLLLTPLLAMFLLGWASFYRTERALHELSPAALEGVFWTRRAYVLFNFRQYLGLVLAPVLLFTTARELLLWVYPPDIDWRWFELASTGLMLLMILVLMPWLLTVIWSTRSLPDGPLRDRLEAAARRLRFRFTDIRIWNTRGDLANAMVTGLLPFPRFVLLSDGLVRHLSADELEAVFGHEVGHVKHGHMPLYLGFFFLSMLLISGLLALLEPHAYEWLAALGYRPSSYVQWGGQVAMIAVMGGYLWLVFGFLSRRCERQADLYGCRAVSCFRFECQPHAPDERGPTATPICSTGIQTFIGALEKVADLNGIERNKASWRHSSIARRVGFLKRVLADPAIEARFQSRLALVKVALVAGLASLAIGLNWGAVRGMLQEPRPVTEGAEALDPSASHPRTVP